MYPESVVFDYVITDVTQRWISRNELDSFIVFISTKNVIPARHRRGSPQAAGF